MFLNLSFRLAGGGAQVARRWAPEGLSQDHVYRLRVYDGIDGRSPTGISQAGSPEPLHWQP